MDELDVISEALDQAMQMSRRLGTNLRNQKGPAPISDQKKVKVLVHAVGELAAISDLNTQALRRLVAYVRELT